ncbi:histidine triad nucleotide-binding protein [Candidatus Omnitrophota bacterium]
MKEDCVFCKIVRKEIEAKIVYEDNKIIAFEDINPQAPTHILLIPKHHIDKLSDVSTQNINVLGRMILEANRLAKERKVQESGYRIVINCNKGAGQEVFHLHVHLLAGRAFGWPPG